MPIAIEPQLLTFRGLDLSLAACPDGTGSIANPHPWMDGRRKFDVDVCPKEYRRIYELLAPRAPFPVAEGGYSWRKIRPGTWGNSSFEDLRPAAEALLAFVDDWSTSAGINAEQFDLMGFSQGAAMVYTLAFLYPDRIRRMAALSGFIPENGEGLFFSAKIFRKTDFH